MARTDTLGHFLTDVADAIRTKTGSSETIIASDFDTEIENIPSGGGDLGDYFNSTISYSSGTSGVNEMIKQIPADTVISGTNMDKMFNGCTSLTTIPLFDTSNITTMNETFRYCTGLTTVPLFNTSKVKTMQGMFRYCAGLTTVPLFNTSNVTAMNGMFTYCSNLVEIPQFNTSKVNTMQDMLNYCSKLTTVPVLDTSSIKFNNGFQNMFSGTTKLTDESLNNILTMCINATSYNGTKTLAFMGFQPRYYSASRIEALSNYQDFINAGWTTGY